MPRVLVQASPQIADVARTRSRIAESSAASRQQNYPIITNFKHTERTTNTITQVSHRPRNHLQHQIACLETYRAVHSAVGATQGPSTRIALKLQTLNP
jgi:hypothetical protein